MNYIELKVDVDPVFPWADILMSALGDKGYESFEETETGIKAYIRKSEYLPVDEEYLLESVGEDVKIEIQISEIEQQNWNAEWESSFDPILVDDWCAVRAPFHEPVQSVEHEIIIEPKMSFGTGHHQTTFLMLKHMKDIDFNDSTVLDFGSGTGILSFLAEKMGAQQVVAVDNEDWAFENCVENAVKNNCQNIIPILGELDSIDAEKFDIILANINKNILVKSMADLKQKLNAGGKLLMSGFLSYDIDDLKKVILEVGLHFDNVYERENWSVIQCSV